MKAPVQIEPVDFFVCFEDGLDRSVGEVIDCGETYLSAVREKEWDLINKENVRCQSNITMEVEYFFGDLDKVPGHMSGFRSCGLSFEGCDIFSPDFVSCDDVVYSNRAVLNLVAADDPCEIFH
jgi:hypothetical protein